MIVNRKIRPQISEITKANLPQINKLTLFQVPVYVIKAPKEDQLTKIVFVFNAGSVYQDKLLTAYSTVKQINEATKNYSNEKIASIFDLKAVRFSRSSGYHKTTFSLRILTKFFTDIAPILNDIFINPIFPKKEFEIFKQRKKQSLAIDLEKVDILARNEFYKVLYGNKHPYGVYALPKDFDKLTIKDLKNYFEKYLKDNLWQIIIISSDTDLIINELEKNFSFNKKKKTLPDLNLKINPAKEKKLHIEKKNAVQTAIRIGKRTINAFDPDFVELEFVTFLFGGYFGSRLMKNIREEKGLTYGIYSVLNSFALSGNFFVDTEVKKEYKDRVIDEVFKELHKLRTQYVDNYEITKVKNYLFGQTLRKYDNPYVLNKYITFVTSYGLGLKYLDNFLQKINKITPERIKELAEKYLNPDDMYVVTVG